MASSSDYDVERMPFLTESDVDDNSQMCRQLLHWLSEKNFADRDSVSVGTLRDALMKTASKSTSGNSRALRFNHNKVHHPL